MPKQSAPPDYALAIYAADQGANPPVVYDLTGEPIDIGSDESNHIVLSGPSVDAYHMAIRQVRNKICGVIDLSVARRHAEQFWLDRRSGDIVLCREHGRLPKHAQGERCPLCNGKDRLLLLRPLQPGDIFPIGSRFEASVLSQATTQTAASTATSPESPWPETDWLEEPPRQPAIFVANESPDLKVKGYPLSDSNLWVWDPPESPMPVFMHQRVSRYTAQHARSNRSREVGGLLLGHAYLEPQSRGVYPVITHCIGARYANESRGHLTFTHETWLDFMRQREEHFPHEEVMGWYHTHPGLDIFLSEWDLTIHRNFFRSPWQVALVLDPHQDRAGLFVWANNEILDPMTPHQPFVLAEADDLVLRVSRPRVRIKLIEERVP